MAMSGRQSSTTSAPAVTKSDELRNVVLVGPSGSGKTRLFEHLLATTTPGYRVAARVEERSTQLTVAAVASGEVVINLIDAPGYPDFVGELRAGLRAADAALFVVSAADGVDTSTRRLWQECAEVSMPRAVAVTKLDAGRADYAAVLADCQAAFGDGVAPLGIPLLGSGGTLDGIVDLVIGEVHEYAEGTRSIKPTGPEHAEFFDTYQGPLIEGVIQEAEDDSLLDRYLEGEELGFETIETALLTAVANGSFHPVIPLSADNGAGVDVLLHLIEAAFPPPTRRPLPKVFTIRGGEGPQISTDPNGPLVAQVVKTTTDAYVGAVALVRLFSGTLKQDQTVHVSGHLEQFTGRELEGHRDHDEDVRIGPLSSPLGDALRPKDTAIAGDLVVVAKLPTAQTSDTLSDKDDPVVIEPWDMPEALLPAAIKAATRGDEDKLPNALQRLAAGDPALRVEHNAETSQVVLWTMGQTHLDLVMSRLKEKLNVNVEVEDLRIALRETFVGPSGAKGRHVKQSGGHGQYAVCDITVGPNERGAGVEFIDKVVGGSVPRQFIPSVEKGVRAQLEKGCLAGYPMVDVKVTLFDGKAHSVDSSDAAFQMAGSLAMKEAAAKPGAATLLEPVDLLTVTVADDHVGAVMTDVQGRRGRILGSEPAGQDGMSVIRAEVPQLELSRYAVDLRSLSHGSGTFTRSMIGYEQMPQRLVADFMKKD